ncbi:hypothetical protein K388_05040 [Streptomyces sp. KhCrAH-43]|uniref:hypothetical protein n=1 Tax=unclassified Streptomyces TaxID=2593676 RepID=UPI00037C3324|nr:MULTISPECIES: hypothetical protein [unclassified Streptomyces]MYX67308.1 hypothetical protein [Streptomyces sp. SID8373]RAJ54906.1 hypothetical protein K388_05040 [Streptomyces sp. KhCrAH-43]
MTATELRQVMDVTGRRDYLLTLIKQIPRHPLTTSDVCSLYRNHLHSTLGRNAARRDLRDLAHRGHLIHTTVDGRRAYRLNPKPPNRHPVSSQESLRALRQAIATEAGEWTPGRARVVLRRATGTHIYRSVARDRLERLHREGLLELRSERPGHCYYAPTMEGTAA